MMALSVKHVAQMAVTKPTSLNFFLRPRLSMGNLHFVMSGSDHDSGFHSEEWLFDILEQILQVIWRFS